MSASFRAFSILSLHLSKLNIAKELRMQTIALVLQVFIGKADNWTILNYNHMNEVKSE